MGNIPFLMNPGYQRMHVTPAFAKAAATSGIEIYQLLSLR
jgi:hypothetical protein